MARATIRQETSRRASKSKINRKRRAHAKRWMLGVGALAALGVAGVIGWQLLCTDTPSRMEASLAALRDRMMEKSGFRLAQVELTGREKSDSKALLSAIGIAQGESIFATTPEAIRQRLEKISTVRHATVTRELPGTLHVAIEERRPIALWQVGGKLHVVDADGVVLEKESPEAHKNLLVVVGDDAAGKLPELFALLSAEKAITPQVVAAVRVGGRRWDLRMKNDVKIMLPEDDAADALHRLAQWQEEKQILGKAITAIDFRLKDRVFIKTTPEDKKKGDGSPSQEI